MIDRWIVIFMLMAALYSLERMNIVDRIRNLMWLA